MVQSLQRTTAACGMLITRELLGDRPIDMLQVARDSFGSPRGVLSEVRLYTGLLSWCLTCSTVLFTVLGHQPRLLLSLDMKSIPATCWRLEQVVSKAK